MNAQMREIIKRKVKPILVLVAIPIAFSILFSCCFGTVYVDEIPIAVCDLDGSQAARDMVEKLQSGSGLSVVLQTGATEEMKEAMLMGTVQAAVVFPEGFGRSIDSSRDAQAMVLINGTNFMISNNAMLYTSNIFNAVNQELRVQLLEEGKIVPYAAEEIGGTLAFTDRILYNPQMSYLRFIILGILGIVIQQSYLTILSSQLVYTKEKLAEHPENIFRPGETYINLLKTAAIYAACSTIGFVASLIMLRQWFEIPMNGGILEVLLLLMVFLLDMTAVSLAVASLFKDEAHCVQFDMFLAIPTMLACSYAWPEFIMPALFAPVMKAVWPLYYFSIPLRDLMLKGAGLGMIGSYIAGGLLFAAFWLPAGAWLYHRSMRRARQPHGQPERKSARNDMIISGKHI